MIKPSDVYTLAVGPWDGSPTQEIGLFGQVTIDSSFDSGCQITFDVPSDSPTAYALGELDTDVWLYAGNGVDPVEVQHRFRVIGVDEAWDENGVGRADVTAVCYKRLTVGRHFLTAGRVDHVTQGVLLLDWIVDELQAPTGGDLGITAPSILSSHYRDREWELGDSIGKLAHDLTGVIDGPWWEIDGELVVVYKDEQGVSYFPTHRTPLTLGGSATTMKRRSSADRFANVAIVTGDAESTVPVIEEAAGLASDPRGRWERVIGTTIERQDTLNERALAEVDEALHPITQWEASIDPARYLTDAGYQIGDFVPLVKPPSSVRTVGVTGEQVLVQIMNSTLTLDADGLATVNVTAMEVPT